MTANTQISKIFPLPSFVRTIRARAPLKGGNQCTEVPGNNMQSNACMPGLLSAVQVKPKLRTCNWHKTEREGEGGGWRAPDNTPSSCWQKEHL